jgi:hypothetical protein
LEAESSPKSNLIAAFLLDGFRPEAQTLAKAAGYKY